jgi:hypothetical protein
MAKAKIVKQARSVTVSIRFTPKEKAALDEAAEADKRPAAQVVQKVIAEWLAAEGFLK